MKIRKKVNPEPTISGILPQKKNAILAIIRKPEGWPSDFRYRDP